MAATLSSEFPPLLHPTNSSADDPFSANTSSYTHPRFTLSELPLVRDQRTTIDALLFKFKKQGHYDTLRKQVWATYNNSEAKIALTDNLYEVADAEIDKDPNLLSRERGKAATLIQGAVERSGVYQDVGVRLDQEILKHLEIVDEAVREIRREEIGDSLAAEEGRRGGKSDETYAAETEARQGLRRQNRARMEELARETAELKAKIRAAAEKKAKAEEDRREEEERKRREDEEERRRAERAKRRAEEDAAEVERVRLRDERAKKREEGRDMRRKELDRDYERRRSNRRSRSRSKSRTGNSRGRSPGRKSSVAVLDEMDLEATALQMLLSEGKTLVAEESKPRGFHDVVEKRTTSRDSEGSGKEEGEARGDSPAPSQVRMDEKKIRDRRPRSASPLGIDRYVIRRREVADQANG